VSRADDIGSLGLLASAMAGRSVEVVAALPGDRTWTDGQTIFVEPAEGRSRLRLVAAQASLLAADSLRSDIVRPLRRHRSLAARYLAVEGQRALGANRAFLPPWLRPMIDDRLAAATSSAGASLALARRERTLVPAWELGMVDPSRITVTPDCDEVAVAASGGTGTATESLDELDEDGDRGLDLGNLLSSPVGGGSTMGRLLAKLLRPARAGDGNGPPGADAPTHVSRGRPRAGSRMTTVGMPDAVFGHADLEASGGLHYPEWDERQQRYRPDWCRVVEDEARPDAASSLVLVEPPALRQALARLGTGRTSCRRRPQGDDVDLDALVEARVDHLTGGPGGDAVYVERLRRRRDLSALVLLDVSGSAAEPGAGGRSVHEHQVEAAAALTTVLHRLGDRVALYAFSSRGRTDVHLARVNGFDEPVDGVLARRLGGLQPGAYTRLGAAIRHGTAVLHTRGGTPRRVLLVLSDGFAYDHGYEGRYGEADARRALLEARRLGIGGVCVSVGADAELGALQRVFGTAAHASVPTTAHLPTLIGPLIATALRTADAQRRRYQRADRTRVRLHAEEARR
jgi:nitric oxide reductase activation protein